MKVSKKTRASWPSSQHGYREKYLLKHPEALDRIYAKKRARYAKWRENTPRKTSGYSKHGQTGTITYRKWQAMLARCKYRCSSVWNSYGGRGITVCERWNRFDNFLADMGIAPKGMVLDRINNNGNYEPSNCRWATRKQNDRNKQSTVYMILDGVEKTLQDWAEIYQINSKTVYCRYKRYGWSPKDSLTIPNSRGKSYNDIKRTN